MYVYIFFLYIANLGPCVCSEMVGFHQTSHHESPPGFKRQVPRRDFGDPPPSVPRLSQRPQGVLFIDLFVIDRHWFLDSSHIYIGINTNYTGGCIFLKFCFLKSGTWCSEEIQGAFLDHLLIGFWPIARSIHFGWSARKPWNFQGPLAARTPIPILLP